MVDFGSGIDLDDDFDLKVTSEGDIGMVSGDKNLQKDLSVRLSEELGSVAIGSRLDSADIEDLRVDLTVLIQEDPRINSVSNIGITIDEDNSNQVNVEITAETDDGPFEDVIPL